MSVNSPSQCRERAVAADQNEHDSENDPPGSSEAAGVVASTPAADRRIQRVVHAHGGDLSAPGDSHLTALALEIARDFQIFGEFIAHALVAAYVVVGLAL